MLVSPGRPGCASKKPAAVPARLLESETTDGAPAMQGGGVTPGTGTPSLAAGPEGLPRAGGLSVAIRFPAKR